MQWKCGKKTARDGPRVDGTANKAGKSNGFQDILSSQPGCITWAKRAIETVLGQVECVRHHPWPLAVQKVIEQETESILYLKVLKGSRSPWWNPLMLQTPKIGAILYSLQLLNGISSVMPIPCPKWMIS